MEKRKSFFALVLVGALLLSGCGTEFADPTTTASVTPTNTAPITVVTDPTNNQTEPEKDYSVNVQYLPQNVNNPDGLPVLKWVVLTQFKYGGTKQRRTEDAVHEVNQMLADKDMPFRIQFILLSTNLRDGVTNWFEIPQLKEVADQYLQEADLIWGMMSADDLCTYFSPITEYVTGNAEPSLENAVLHPLEWEQTTVKGEIYGIPTGAEGTLSMGWRIDPELLKNCGLSAEDFKRDFSEMDDIFAEIYEKNGNQPFFSVSRYSGTLTVLNPNGNKTFYPLGIYQMITTTAHHAGACFNVDYSSGVPKIVNYLETDYVRSVQKAMLRYREAGYVQQAVSEKTNTVTFAATIGNTPYIDMDNQICVPVVPAVEDYQIIPNTSGVGISSQQKEQALALLRLIAEDEAFRMQLMFGKEGRDYQIVDGSYVPVYQEDGSSYCMDILSPYAYFSGLYAEGDPGLSAGTSIYWGSIVHEGKTRLQTYRDVMDDVDVKHCRVTFDATVLEQEYAAVEKILNEYLPTVISITGENRMTEERYNEMLQKLKDAGCEKIQAELQRQLDEWLAENPDWQQKGE